MKYLKLFEAFSIEILRTERRAQIESEWGLTIEDLEDILLELSDSGSVRSSAWGDIEACQIKTPTQEKRVRVIQDGKIKIKIVPELIVLSKLIHCDFQTYESIVNGIKKRLAKWDIRVEDSTIEHSETHPDRDIFFVCLRLISNKDLELMKIGRNKLFY